MGKRSSLPHLLFYVDPDLSPEKDQRDATCFRIASRALKRNISSEVVPSSQEQLDDLDGREAAAHGRLLSHPSGEETFVFNGIVLEYRYEFFNRGPSGVPTIVVGTVFTP